LEADAVGVELRHFLLERAQKEVHQDRDLLGGAAPVLAREREQRQVFDVALDAGEDDRPHGLHPAAVAVHDDRDVTGHGGRCGYFARGAREHGVAEGGGFGASWSARGRSQITIRSASFAESTLSTSAMKRSVSFCTSVCACRSSSSATAWSFSSFL